MLNKFFLDHPADVGESYSEHMRAASGYGFTLIGAGLACLVHAAVPAFFKTKGSDTIRALHERLVRKRGAQRDAQTEARYGGWVI
ncbi:DUF6356 family protein [Sphingomonas abietis]|uniref:DUF6356 family protein n=1 Tax=Sphingomonas abietis TaxID=3012344 RepID=A0ABY7NMP1_9SPHN|nr:DUF6356 family protein [Sphingomonas abietis]WBO22623.1 DUF6356 family protein [Sphingomonas abietis]